jgi:hypothetical protein
MWIPSVRERVRVQGDNDSFFIVNVDHFRKLVKMIPVAGASPVIEDVPFEFLELEWDFGARKRSEAAAD